MPTENNPMKSAIDRRLSALCVPDDMAQRIQAAAQKKRPRVIRFRRPLAVAAVFCLVLACSMGVLATTVPSAQNLFAIVGTQISSMLQPIERSCTDNGIETTVVAAMNDNDMVDIYVAVKDLEGSRINERTNLADVQLSGIAMTPMVQMVQFDEKTATATFRIEGVCGEDLNGKKITLSIGAVLLGRTEWSDQNTGISVSDIETVFPSPAFQPITGNATRTTVGFSDSGAPFNGDQALVPAESDGSLDSMCPWGGLTSGGVADNALHLQLKYSAVGKYAQFTQVFLMTGKPEKDEKLPIHSIDFGKCETRGGSQYYEYTEYILPLPQGADPEKLTVAYSGISYEDAVLGKWETTFRLESVSRQRVAHVELNIGGWHVTQVELSPMGVSVTVDDNGSSDPLPEILAYDKSGAPIPVNGSSSSWNGTERICKNQFTSPLPLEQISRVTIGGVEIDFKN